MAYPKPEIQLDGILETYLRDPPSAFSRSYPVVPFSAIPTKIFEARLSMIINTFLRASLDMPSLAGGNGISVENDTTWGNTTATWTQFTGEVYNMQRRWFALYISSTLILTLCGLFNIVLRSMVRAPDFLSSVSALTRDSQFIDVPPGGSTMDGPERTRLLKDKWVLIQDVKRKEEVGRIAFSDAKSGGRLDWSRRYE